jgi:hypothetical protein
MEELKVPVEQITEIVSGAARGIDSLGERWAEYRPDPIPVKQFPADWDTHGKAAGPIRNRAMADYADALLVVWDGKSRGTKNMLDHVYRLKKPVYKYIYNKEESKDV